MKIVPNTFTFGKLMDYADSFCVPMYQRNYSWRRGYQLTDLWSDILGSINEPGEHFMGAMYFVPRDDRQNSLWILDGQQRFSTFILILSVLKDRFETLGDEESIIHAKTIADAMYKIPMGETKRVPKLEMNMLDRDYFTSIVVERKPGEQPAMPADVRESQKLIFDAYQFFEEKIEDELKNSNNKQFLQNIYRTLLNKFSFLTVQIDTIENAQKVFETLNDRGLELSEGDLIKNHLLRVIKNEGTDSEALLQCQVWDQSMECVEKNFAKFLKHYLSSLYGLVRKDDLYKTVKDKVNTKEQALMFVKKIAEASEIYSNLEEPSFQFWDDDNVVNLIKEIRTLGVSQVNVLLLALYRKYYNNGDRYFFIKMLETILNMTFRYSTICARNPNRLEVEYSKMAEELTNGKIDQDTLMNSIRSLSPSREEFLVAFEHMDMKGGWLARYMLIKICNQELKEQSGTGEIRLLVDSDEVHLEHILPQKPNDDWLRYCEENGIEWKPLVYKVGNLTLFKGKWNRSISNKAFSLKKEKYAESWIPMTNRLATFSEWNGDTIAQRQREMAGQAERIWNVSVQ